VVEFEGGLLTYACEWADQGGSHLVWLQRPQAAPDSRVYPCSHYFELVRPAGAPAAPHALRRKSPDENSRSEWALWLPLGKPGRATSRRLRLWPVETGWQWAEMTEMRDEVEQEYPGYQPATTSRMVEHIRHRLSYLDGDWYLAEVNGTVVGGIGLLVFQTPAGKVGRLQDVDIRPGRRGEGLGDELLRAACGEAVRLGLDALCLKADGDDWPKEWYLRLGFTHVGTWTRFKVHDRNRSPASRDGAP